MATQEKTWNVANRLHSLKDSDNPEVNHIIAGADEIYDDSKGAKQSDINAQTDAALADRYTKAETYSKEQLDSLITTPDANYVTVATFADLPQTGEANTIYRVSSYDGTQVDASKYALYAWNGATYQLLAVRSAVGEVFDVSDYNSGATYETLSHALAAVPSSVQRGGMSIKFILRTNTGTEEEPVYHDEYVQYLLKNTAWSITPSDWESTDGNNTIHINDAQHLTDTQKAQALANMGISGIDGAPTAGSDNLVRSGGVQNEFALGAVYDVSAKNPTAGPNNDGKFESLSALLSDNNLNTLIPTSVRRGGMSIKFVQSSDNKYIQYIYVGTSTAIADFTNTDNWERTNLQEEVLKLDKKIGTDIDVICPISAGGEYANLNFRLAEGEDVGLYVDADAIATPSLHIAFYIYRAEGSDSISKIITNKKVYPSLRGIFNGYSGVIYGFAYYITGTSGAGNVITTFKYYGIKDDIAETNNRITSVSIDVSRVENLAGYAQRNAGGLQTINLAVETGKSIDTDKLFKVFIAKESKYRLVINTELLNDSINFYEKYADGTASSSKRLPLNGGSAVYTAPNDIVAFAFYIPAAKIVSSGTVIVNVDIKSLLEIDYNSKFSSIINNAHAVKLKGIAPDSSGLSEVSIGDYYFNTLDNFLYEITRINPIDTKKCEDLTNVSAVFEYNGELFVFDGVSLSRFHDNTTDNGRNKVIFDYSKYLVGPDFNNDNPDSDRHTYIYKNICSGDIAADEFIRVSCESIVGSVDSSPIKVYVTDAHGQKRSIRAVGAGTFDVYPSVNDVKYTICLYPSKTGMSVRYATFTNIKVEIIKPVLPAYYIKDDYLKNKIDVIRSLIKAADGNYDAFAFVTDVHWPNNMKHTPDILAYLQTKIVLPRLMMGGDYADGINIDANNAFDAFNGRVYKAAGNHEYMNYLAEMRDNSDMHVQDITGGDIWAFLNNGMYDAVIGDASKNYYYVDNPVQKMRYIFLNVFTDGSVGEFEQAQEDWLDNVALNMPVGYLAVVFAHFYMYAANWPTSWEPVMTPIGSRIAAVVDAHIGNVACMIAGHTHMDLMKKTNGGVPIFVTTCDKANPDIDETSEKDAYIYGKRTNGTINEQAFDVVVINKKDKKVSFVRIGCPADNGGDTPLEIREQTYGA